MNNSYKAHIWRYCVISGINVLMIHSNLSQLFLIPTHKIGIAKKMGLFLVLVNAEKISIELFYQNRPEFSRQVIDK